MKPIEIIENIIYKKGLKKSAVANRMGITPQQFSDMLNGRRTLKATDVIPICKALDITPNELYGIDNQSA